MQGMRFLTVGEQGPTNHGIIAGRITAEKYLCNFAKNPTSCRVCDITEIQQWHLFHTDDEMNAFILALRKEQAPAPAEIEALNKEAKKKFAAIKKKASKKKLSKKTIARARDLANKKVKKKVKHNGTK